MAFANLKKCQVCKNKQAYTCLLCMEVHCKKHYHSSSHSCFKNGKVKTPTQTPIPSSIPINSNTSTINLDCFICGTQFSANNANYGCFDCQRMYCLTCLHSSSHICIAQVKTVNYNCSSCQNVVNFSKNVFRCAECNRKFCRTCVSSCSYCQHSICANCYQTHITVHLSIPKKINIPSNIPNWGSIRANWGNVSSLFSGRTSWFVDLAAELESEMPIEVKMMWDQTLEAYRIFYESDKKDPATSQILSTVKFILSYTEYMEKEEQTAKIGVQTDPSYMRGSRGTVKKSGYTHNFYVTEDKFDKVSLFLKTALNERFIVEKREAPVSPVRTQKQYTYDEFENLIVRLDIPVDDIVEMRVTKTLKHATKVYRKAAMILHPDKNNGDGSKMTELNLIWNSVKGQFK